MGLFGGIKEAKFNSGGVYFEPGSYRVKVAKISSGNTREGSRPFFVAEFTILESSNPKRPAGTSVSWMVMLDKFKETALGNIKGFVSALYGIAQDDVDEAGVEALISAENPGQGKEVLAVASMTKTKKGDDFTKVVFSPAA